MNVLHGIFIQPWQDAAYGLWPILAEGALVSCALALLGCFLVVRGMSLLGDALSHAVLPGIVVGFLISAQFGHASLSSPWIFVCATIVGIGASVLVETVQKQSRVKADAALGITFTTMFALGVVLISRYAGQADLDPGCVLYGNIEYFILKRDDIVPMAVILAAIVVAIVIFYRPLLVSTFDPALATSVGIAAGAVHYALMGALSLTIVASFQAVGAILAVALLIVPGATARLWTQRLSHMLVLACAFALISTAIGYWLSHANVLDTSASAAMGTAGFAIFMMSWLIAPRQGIASRWFARHQLRRKIALENLIKTIDELAAAGPTRAHESVSSSALSKELRWSEAEIARTARRGSRAGYLHISGTDANRAAAANTGTITLTPAGAARARRLALAHVAWEEYLQRQLNLKSDHVHDAAEWIEHYLEDEKLSELQSA